MGLFFRTSCSGVSARHGVRFGKRIVTFCVRSERPAEDGFSKTLPEQALRERNPARARQLEGEHLARQTGASSASSFCVSDNCLHLRERRLEPYPGGLQRGAFEGCIALAFLSVSGGVSASTFLNPGWEFGFRFLQVLLPALVKHHGMKHRGDLP